MNVIVLVFCTCQNLSHPPCIRSHARRLRQKSCEYFSIASVRLRPDPERQSPRASSLPRRLLLEHPGFLVLRSGRAGPRVIQPPWPVACVTGHPA